MVKNFSLAVYPVISAILLDRSFFVTIKIIPMAQNIIDKIQALQMASLNIAVNFLYVCAPAL